MNDYFVTMKEIGAEFGVTSHAIGKKLKELGLRTADGKPSSRAFDDGYCDQKWTQDEKHYLWAWHLGLAPGMKRVNASSQHQVSASTNLAHS